MLILAWLMAMQWHLSLQVNLDSYSMDLNTFKAQLQARLSEWNDNEDTS